MIHEARGSVILKLIFNILVFVTLIRNKFFGGLQKMQKRFSSNVNFSQQQFSKYRDISTSRQLL